MESPGPVNPELVFSLRRVTERAATAAFSWIGRGDSQDAGRAALAAMRAALAGAVMAAIPGSGIDALMGTGGTPEGVMSACAIRAMGGEFLARLDPQLQTEAKAVKEAGIDTSKWYERDEIITSK